MRNMDVVQREEFEAVKQMAAKAREENERLQQWARYCMIQRRQGRPEVHFKVFQEQLADRHEMERGRAGDVTDIVGNGVETVPIDVREFHVYGAEWTPEHVAFFVDHRLVKTVDQSPGYPMQFMLDIYEFPDDGQPAQPSRPYPKEFVVDYFRGYRPATP